MGPGSLLACLSPGMPDKSSRQELPQYVWTACFLVASMLLLRFLGTFKRTSTASLSNVGPTTPTADLESVVNPFVMTVFQPTPTDVFEVKAILQICKKVPAELVEEIIDYAEYWPHSETWIWYDEQLFIHGSRDEEDKCLVCPFPRLHRYSRPAGN